MGYPARAGAIALGASLFLIASPAAAKKPPPPPPPPPPCEIVSGPDNFACGGVKGAHIFLDDGKGLTATTAEYPKQTDPDNVAITFNTGATADVANGFANIKPDGTALLTDITFTFTDLNAPVTGFLFRGQLNEETDPIVVTVTDQNNVAEVFNYFINGNDNSFDTKARASPRPSSAKRSNR